MRARIPSSAAVAVACALRAATPSVAHADDRADLCLADSIEGQVLRNNGHLLRASEHLSACAQPACEREIRERCSTWLAKATAAIPSLHVVIRDDQGAPIPGALVHVDDLLVGTLGRIPLDPGKHIVRVDYAARSATRELVLDRGDIAATVTLDLRSTVTERPTPRLAYALGGTALVAAAAFAGFATSVFVQQHHLDECAPYCAPSRRSPLEVALVGSDISLGVSVGGALGAVGVYLARPTVARQVRLAIGPQGAGASWAF